jgi:hypothetical protein
MSRSEISSAVQPLVRVFDAMGIRYFVSGSVAGSLYGMARATLDIDIAAAILPGMAGELVEVLQDDYYITRESVADAAKRGASFNLIHLETMIKVDVFVVGSRPFDMQALARSNRETIDDEDDGSEAIAFATAEDVVLNKLRWYRQTGSSSTRQWDDIVTILEFQRDRIDTAYLYHWAQELAVTQLLDRALEEAK